MYLISGEFATESVSLSGVILYIAIGSTFYLAKFSMPRPSVPPPHPIPLAMLMPLYPYLHFLTLPTYLGCNNNFFECIHSCLLSAQHAISAARVRLEGIMHPFCISCTSLFKMLPAPLISQSRSTGDDDHSIVSFHGSDLRSVQHHDTIGSLDTNTPSMKSVREKSCCCISSRICFTFWSRRNAGKSSRLPLLRALRCASWPAC